MRYQLFIKQCVQLAGYDTDENAESRQKIMIVFTSNDKDAIISAAVALKKLHSNTGLIIYDSVSSKKTLVKIEQE